MAEDKRLPIEQANLQQLSQVKQSLDTDIQNLQVTTSTMSEASSRFMQSGKCVEQLAKSKEGDELLVPLTSSLYIPGKLTNLKSVLVEVGTGYYCSKSITAAKKYCDDKVSMINEQVSTMNKTLKEKQNQLGQVEAVMQQRQQEAQQAGS
jgi:prefoldin alpha subunit